MITFFVCFLLSAFASEEKNTEWNISKTEKVTIVSFDADCVQIKDSKGQLQSLKRSGFKDMKMISGKTQVEIHPETVQKDLCPIEKK